MSLWANKNGLKLISNGCITVSILKTTELCALSELCHVLIISLYWAVFNKLYKVLKEYIGSEFGVHESSCTTRPIVYMNLFPKGHIEIDEIIEWYTWYKCDFQPWRRKWQPTPVFLPGESQGRGSLVDCCLWDHRVGHDWSDLAAAAATRLPKLFSVLKCQMSLMQSYRELVCNTLTFLTHALIRLIQVQWDQSFLLFLEKSSPLSVLQASCWEKPH